MSFFYSKTNEMHQFLKFILFCSCTLHVSDGFSVHHQKSKTVHTASGICHTGSVAACYVSVQILKDEQNCAQLLKKLLIY
jgi:hypothetical protein